MKFFFFFFKATWFFYSVIFLKEYCLCISNSVSEVDVRMPIHAYFIMYQIAEIIHHYITLASVRFFFFFNFLLSSLLGYWSLWIGQYNCSLSFPIWYVHSVCVLFFTKSLWLMLEKMHPNNCVSSCLFLYVHKNFVGK